MQSSRRPRRGAEIALALAAVVATLLVLEVAARVLLVRSDGFGHTLAARAWFARHWGPVNQLGLRDAEPSAEALARHRRLFVLGDSIAAGHGIDERADRFGDRLAAKLGPGWSYVLLAQNGWSTADERDALRRFPVGPDLLVVAYCPNDVEGAAKEAGYELPRDLEIRPGWLRPLVERSHLANHLYWRVERSRFSDRMHGYMEAIETAGADPRVAEIHRREIQDVVAYGRSHGAVVVAVLFPNLLAPDASGSTLDLALATFVEAGVPVIDLRERIRGRAADELVVNELDPHPSAALHAEVADVLFERFGARVAIGSPVR